MSRPGRLAPPAGVAVARVQAPALEHNPTSPSCAFYVQPSSHGGGGHRGGGGGRPGGRGGGGGGADWHDSRGWEGGRRGWNSSRYYGLPPLGWATWEAYCLADPYAYGCSYNPYYGPAPPPYYY